MTKVLIEVTVFTPPIGVYVDHPNSICKVLTVCRHHRMSAKVNLFSHTNPFKKYLKHIVAVFFNGFDISINMMHFSNFRSHLQPQRLFRPTFSIKCLLYISSWQYGAVFTLRRNMFSLITNKTCFTIKSVHCASHDRNMFSRNMIETISRGSLDLSRTKHISTNVSLLNTASPFVLEEHGK